MTSLRIVFAGSGEFGIPTLGALLDAGHEVVQVITQPDRPAGRGRAISPTAIATCAAQRGLSAFRTADINALPLLEADVLVVIAFGQKIAPHVVDHSRLGSINLHASRLPKYRGAAPINWAIIDGETTTGNSVIRLAQKMDAGTVLAQSQIAIGELETAGELHDRLAGDGAPLVLGVLDALSRGTAVETEQDASLVTIARKLSRDSSRIDWQREADKIAGKIRGMYPWPGCRIELMNGEKALDTLTLVRARAARAPADDAPAAVLPDGISCGSGTSVQLIEVQPAGKRPMPFDAYQRGHPWERGMRARSV